MTLRRNLSWMGLTTVVRLGTGLLTFTVMARVLGPQGYGVFVLWLSIAVLAAMVTNFGLVPYVLKEVAMSPSTAATVLDEGFTGKMLLAGLVFVTASIVCVIVGFTGAHVFLVLLGAAIADSFSEFMCAGLRARGRFDVESRIISAGSIFHSLLMIAAVYVSHSVIIVAISFAISRLLITSAMFVALSRHVSRPRLRSLGAAVRRLRAAVSYALDYAFQSLFGQVDSVVLNHFLGPVAVGNYQAGMRIFQTAAQVVSVFSNVFLPRVAAQQGSVEIIGQENNRIQLVFIAAGGALGVAMAAFAEQLVHVVLGAAYAPLVPLLPLFGLLFFLRFSASAWGILLTATGHQTYRTGCSAVFWVVTFALAGWLVPIEASRGWLLSLCTGTLVLIVSYAWRGRNLVQRAWIGVALPLGAGVPLLLLAARG